VYLREYLSQLSVGQHTPYEFLEWWIQGKCALWEDNIIHEVTCRSRHERNFPDDKVDEFAPFHGVDRRKQPAPEFVPNKSRSTHSNGLDLTHPYPQRKPALVRHAF